jgi:amino-acid N-acetyltransferase
MQVQSSNTELPPAVIDRLPTQDLAAICLLLDSASLPHTDLTEASLQQFLVARRDNHIVGVVGLDCYEDVALLRSVVVAKEHSGFGIGKQLVAAAETFAAKIEIKSLYLLTTTADRFFAGLGFRRLQRDLAPQAIKRTSQFSSLCPATAVLMGKP